MSIGHDQAAALLGSMSSLVRATRAVAHRQSGDMGASGTPIGVLKTLRAGDARPSDLAAALHVAPPWSRERSCRWRTRDWSNEPPTRPTGAPR